MIKTCKKELQVALTIRERKELLNEWSPFDRLARYSSNSVVKIVKKIFITL